MVAQQFNFQLETIIRIHAVIQNQNSVSGLGKLVTTTRSKTM
jgi:hypothetical protein